MADLGAATIRLSVRGSSGSVDLAVPPWADLGSIGREYAAATGRPSAPELVTTTGLALDPTRPLHQLDLAPGDVLVALDTDAVSSHGGGATAVPEAGLSREGSGRGVLLVAAVGCALAASLTGALSAPGTLRTASVAVLLVATLAAGASVPAVRGALGNGLPLSAPAFAGTAGFLMVHSSRPGAGVLALAVGALAAAVAAAVVRARADARLERLLRVWLLATGTVAVSAAVALGLDVPERSLLAWLFLVAVVAARVLPYLVVDVPDEALLDLDRLAVTAWSPRERPRRPRRRSVVRPDGVAELLRQGRELLVAGAVAVSAVASVATLVWGRPPDRGAAALGVHLLLLCGGAALALSARAHRSAVPRAALRLPAVLAVTAVLVVGLRDLSGVWAWWSVVAIAFVSLAVVAAAVAVGRGWRSLWWARVADVVEAVSVVGCVAAFPLAAGVFDLVRRLPS